MVALIAMALSISGTAQATVPHDGWGFAVADDDSLSGASPNQSLTSPMFERLRPKTFRLQIYWNATESSPDPGGTCSTYVKCAEEAIKYVKAHGVQEVVVTFKKHEFVPSVSQYKTGIRKVIEALHPLVDVWGPANEPNAGETWLPGTGASGAGKLAEFNTALKEVVETYDETAERTSPDFGQAKGTTAGQIMESNEKLEAYVKAYLAAGGGWGHYVAFHNYTDIGNLSLSGLSTLDGLVPSTKTIWITEVGAFGVGHGFNYPFTTSVGIDQTDQVKFMVNQLANWPSVSRIYYYHMKGKPSGSTWDTALLNENLSRRQAWYMWCAASHNFDITNPDCAGRQWSLRSSNDPATFTTTSFNYGDLGSTPIAGDWNNDGVDSPGIVRGTLTQPAADLTPGSGNEWYLRNSNTTGSRDLAFIYGNPTGMAPITGDWNNDGTDTPGMVTSGASFGTWYLRNANSTGVSDLSFTYGTGLSNAVAFPGDWDGDGDDTPGARWGNTWYLRNSNTSGVSEISFAWGNPGGHVSLSGDWDGDGDETSGIYETATSRFYLRNTHTGGVDSTFIYGNPGNMPVVGDWNGDGIDTVGVVHQSP